MIFDFFLLKSFGEHYDINDDILYVNDNFIVGTFLDMDFGYCAPSEANIFVNDNILVVFRIMDLEGHLLNVNKIFTIFFFGKINKCNFLNMLPQIK